MLRTHLRDCESATCGGCEPCPERHCGLCGREHVTVDGRGDDQTCAACIGVVRHDLQRIEDMAAVTLIEATHRGVNSEAANLAGPVPASPDDFEAWGFKAMSAAMGRIPDLGPDPVHPTWVLGTWEMLVREHYAQPTDERVTTSKARAYLDGHLHRLAQDPEFAFEELARDVRVCRGHLEDVLRFGERPDKGAPCPMCGRAVLVKDYGSDEAEDRWVCPKCDQWWTEDDYRSKVGGIYLTVAEVLTAGQIAETYRVPEGTVRRWASVDPKMRRGYDGQRRQLYDVARVLQKRDQSTETDEAAVP